MCVPVSVCNLRVNLFPSRCARISMLFCELKSYEGAIDVMEVLLRACYAGLQFHGIRNLVATRSNKQEIERKAQNRFHFMCINRDIN